MTTALAPVTGGVPTQIGTDDLYSELAKKGGDFTKGIKLYTKGGPIDKGLIAPGHYGVYEGKDDITDLGVSIDLLILARRPFAIDMSDKEDIKREYNANSEAFADIRSRAGAKDSGCQCGVELLVFERSTGQFYAWFCGSKSTLRAAAELFGYMPIDDEMAKKNNVEARGPIPVTCNVQYIESRFSFHVPKLAPCSTPFSTLPEESVFVAEINKFCNPPGSEVEDAKESDLAGRAR